MSGLVTTPLSLGAGALFGAISVVRRARSLHPDGLAFAATFRSPLLGDGEGVVRFSRGAGLPRPLPGGLGIALGGGGQGGVVARSGPAPGARHLLVPAGHFARRTFSSVLPFEVGGRTLVLGAEP